MHDSQILDPKVDFKEYKPLSFPTKPPALQNADIFLQ